MVNKCQIELQKETVTTLKKICQMNYIKGCSGKKKNDLVDHICKAGRIKKEEDPLKYSPDMKTPLYQLNYDKHPLTERGVKSFIIAPSIEQDNIFDLLLKEGYIKSLKKGNQTLYTITDKGSSVARPLLDLPEKLMTKTLNENLINSFKELAKENYEYSIGLDFERYLKSPERGTFMKGGSTSTIRIPDYELFGHTHPRGSSAEPSIPDLKNMYLNEPEFITNGTTVYFFNVENEDRHDKWKYNVKNTAVPMDLIRKEMEKNPKLKIDPWNLFGTKDGRALFFKQTGIKVTPYKKGKIKVKMKMDDIREKPIPTANPSKIEQWHRGMKEQNEHNIEYRKEEIKRLHDALNKAEKELKNPGSTDFKTISIKEIEKTIPIWKRLIKNHEISIKKSEEALKSMT